MQEHEGVVTGLSDSFKIGEVAVKAELLQLHPRFTTGDRLYVKGDQIVDGGGGAFLRATEVRVISDWRRLLCFALVFLTLAVAGFKDYLSSSHPSGPTYYGITLSIVLSLVFAGFAWRARRKKWPPNNLLRWL